MPAIASLRSGSERKKSPMSFAIFTRCSALPCCAPSCCAPPRAALLGGDGIGCGALQQRFLSFGELAEALLPLGRLIDARRLYGRNLVLRTIGGPVGILRGNHIRTRLREMEGGVNHAWLHPLGDARAQHRVARAAHYAHPVALRDAALLGVVRMDLQAILIVPAIVLGAPRLGADVVLAQDAPGGEDQRIPGVDFL